MESKYAEPYNGPRASDKPENTVQPENSISLPSELDVKIDNGVLRIKEDSEYVCGPHGAGKAIDGTMDLDGSFTIQTLKELVRVWEKHGDLGCRQWLTS